MDFASGNNCSPLLLGLGVGKGGGGSGKEGGGGGVAVLLKGGTEREQTGTKVSVKDCAE